jgi:hypothetical protein
MIVYGIAAGSFTRSSGAPDAAEALRPGVARPRAHDGEYARPFAGFPSMNGRICRRSQSGCGAARVATADARTQPAKGTLRCGDSSTDMPPSPTGWPLSSSMVAIVSQASSNGAVGVPLSGLARLVLWLRLWLGLVGGPVWLLASCRFVVAFEGFGAVNTSGSRTGCPRRICAGSERSRGGSDARLEASRSVPKWADPGAGSQASSVNDASHTQWRRPGDGATRSLAP